MPVQQTQGRFYKVGKNAWSNSRSPDGAARAARADEERQKAEQEADQQRRETERTELREQDYKDRAQRQQDRYRQNLADAEQKVALANERLDAANSAWEMARDDLNGTLKSARRWLIADKLAVVLLEVIGLHAGLTYASLRVSPTLLHRLELGEKWLGRPYHGYETANAIVTDCFPPISDYPTSWSPEEIAEYGRAVDALADEGGFEGAQVMVEGRYKLRAQFETAAAAKQEQLTAQEAAVDAKGNMEMWKYYVEQGIGRYIPQ